MPVGARDQGSTLRHPGGAERTQKPGRVRFVTEPEDPIVVADHKSRAQPQDLARGGPCFVQPSGSHARHDERTVPWTIIWRPRHAAPQFNERLLRLSASSMARPIIARQNGGWNGSSASAMRNSVTPAL